MNKKVLVIVGLAAVIAVSGGVISIAGNNSGHVRGADGDPATTAVNVETYAPDDDSTSDAISDETSAVDISTEPAELDDDNGDDIYGYGDDIVSVASYNISSVIDNTTGKYCTPREVFGSLYYYCYLAFKSDGTLELCINPTAGEILKGRYSIYRNVISVLYDDGTGAEYDVISNSSGEVDRIIVRYGEYDVYFG